MRAALFKDAQLYRVLYMFKVDSQVGDVFLLTQDLNNEWSTDGLDYTCKQCAFHDGQFDVGASLERIYGAASERHSCTDRSEELLLKAYRIALPQLKAVETIHDRLAGMLFLRLNKSCSITTWHITFLTTSWETGMLVQGGVAGSLQK
ncbi:hypothetical protein RRG08_014566 [Elysia crispata]|uniref:Uncharacterized protein n=1 Tax=Elysia crispata TaxID=231223 RepID=A0AAE1ATF4_9GAST|nr:hypothetical protein RRG08_014566 [Elysia crispata]